MKTFIRSFFPPVIVGAGIGAMIMVAAMVNHHPHPALVAETEPETIPETTIHADPEPEPKPKASKPRYVSGTINRDEDVGSARRRMPEHAVRSSSVRETDFYQKDGYHHEPAQDVEFTENVGFNPGQKL